MPRRGKSSYARPVTGFACGIFQDVFHEGMRLRKKNVVLIEVIQWKNTEGFMKRFAVVIVILTSALAGAATMSDFESKSAADRSACVANFIAKMTTDTPSGTGRTASTYARCSSGWGTAISPRPWSI
jgi:hypothetical protein